MGKAGTDCGQYNLHGKTCAAAAGDVNTELYWSYMVRVDQVLDKGSRRGKD